MKLRRKHKTQFIQDVAVHLKLASKEGFGKDLLI